MDYPWTRYWHPWSQETPLDTYGFLNGPVPWVKSELMTLDALLQEQCLILLGEPGVGKSNELNAEASRLKSSGEFVLSIDLGEYSSDARLDTAITHSAVWQHWLMGTGRLYLFLDGLDEGQLVIPTLCDAIVHILRDSPVERLYLRLSCRSADWPATFETRLQGILYSKGCLMPRVLKLAVLRRSDIMAAAQVEGVVDPDAFLERVCDLRVGALAARPVTLKLLLNVWRRHGGDLPVDQLDLYEKGCVELCREPDEERRERGAIHEQFRWPDPVILVDAAAWVAVLTQISNRPFILDSDSSLDDDSETLPITRVFRSQAVPEGVELPDRQLLTCLFRTGLFTSSGRHRYAWAHRTYAEFLVARSLQRAPLVQILSVLIHPYGDGTKIVPQLHEIAAWLAAFRQDLFDWLLNHNPMLLLRSDVVLPDSIKGNLVGHVLNQAATMGRSVYHDVGQWARKLVHPGLAAQLGSLICDRQKPTIERYDAMVFAYFAGITSMATTLAAVALDPTEPMGVRREAADCVRHFGVPEALVMLEPLARGAAGDDPDDELRGIGLRCMWPAYWSVAQVMVNLTQPKNRHLIGSFRRFMGDFLAGVRDQDVGAALRAAKDWTLSPTSERVDLLQGLLVRAWALRYQSDVLLPLAHGVLTFIHQRHMLPINLEGDTTYRRRLVVAIVSECGASAEDVLGFTYRGLLLPDDMLWLCDQVADASETLRPTWAITIGELVHRCSETVGEWSDALEQTRKAIPAVADRVSWIYKVWNIRSPEARSAKAQYLRHKRLEKRLEPRTLSPSPVERAAKELERIENGEPERWPFLCYWLGIEPQSPQAWVFVEDLTSTPGWRAAPDLHDRIQEAAKLFIAACGPQGEVWMGQGEVAERGLEGYLAFRLVASTPFADHIPADIWARWVPILIRFPTNHRDDLKRVLAATAYRMAPDSVINYVRQHLATGNPHIIYEVEHCWDDRLSSEAFAVLQREDLSPGLREHLAPALIRHGYVHIFSWLLSELKLPSQSDEGWRVRVATHLIHAGVQDVWEVLFDSFAQRPDFGKEVCSALACDRWMHSNSQFPQTCSEEVLGRLWETFYAWFPPQTDPSVSGLHHISRREDVGRLRNNLLMHLANRGTAAACAVSERLRSIYPEVARDLGEYLLVAEENTRRNTWHPPTPLDLLALLTNPDKRYVSSADQLLDLTVEALERIQARLLGRWNMASLLWDQVQVQPKNEQALSDFLAIYLHEELVARGIAVNREVEIKHGTGSAGAWKPGLRTDLLVDAVPKGSGGDVRRLSVIIEVKGCWNKELKTAMQKQLVERYLPDQHCSHGIYVVGWFRCPAWDQKDSRLRKTPALTFEKAADLFRSQAESLAQAHPELRIRTITLDLRLQ